ncbi:hypothetical protein HJG60_007871 [Phyllostomus discolor]|uniref:Uncharacterized protein n=1 Tax=Phyllostomus discolor TaxID=89673 RepID=A0A834EVK2_9CHIR|nr:hypothetical protein HJG60_007871 [Phyllostomus discolor]
MGARDDKSDAAPGRPCGHPPPPQLQPRSAPSPQPLALTHSHPSPGAPSRPACPASLPALRPPAVSSSGAQLPIPLARPVLSLLFALSKHCPGHVSQQQPTHRSSLPPRRPPRLAPGCYGNASRAQS